MSETATMPVGDRETTPKQRPRLVLSLGALMLAGTAFGLMQSLLVPALPTLARHLGASAAEIPWVLSIFLLSSSVLTPVIGRAGDLYGRRRLLAAVLLVFSAGILVSGLAESLPVMLVGRALQGAGAGVFPLAFGIVRATFPPRRVAGAIGAISSVIGIGGGVGLVLPGFIINGLGIAWLFWIPLILNLVAVPAVIAFIGKDRAAQGGRLNLISTVLMAAAFTALLLTINEASTLGWWTLVAIIGTAALFTGWIIYERHSRAPLIDMTVMRIRNIWASNAAALFIGAAMFMSFLLVPLYVETPSSLGYGLGASVTIAGLMMVPTAAPQLVIGPLAGLFDRTITSRVALMLGATLLVISFVLLASWAENPFLLITATTLIGIGLGLAIPALANVTVQTSPPEHIGGATAINTVVRNIGGAIGSQVAATVLAASVTTSGPTESSYTVAFTIGGISAVIALGSALVLRRQPSTPYRKATS